MFITCAILLGRSLLLFLFIYFSILEIRLRKGILAFCCVLSIVWDMRRVFCWTSVYSYYTFGAKNRTGWNSN